MAHRNGTAAAAVLAAGLAAAVAGCAMEGSAPTPAPSAASATAVLEAKSGSTLEGTATFRPMGDGWVEFHVDVHGVTPGIHAIHVHDKGDCSSPDGKSTGGHWNPYAKNHGKFAQADGQFHLGDIGNIDVGPDGSGSLTLTTNLWTIGGGGENDVVGHSIIVHGAADDFTTQPTGNAGDRIGAGPIVLDGK